ncbi:MAG: ABC transporter permease [Deltaproteobacteria bacterium]|nr:ABC transporter permease [Deltaproteobacteria bacterium]
MTIFIGAFIIGLILSFLTIGVFISFRVLNFTDITADGSFALGGALAASLLVMNINPALAVVFAFLGGGLAGSVTGLLHTHFRIPQLLSGILVMTGLYSINLRIMGKSNIPLFSEKTVISCADGWTTAFWGADKKIGIFGGQIAAADMTVLLFFLMMIVFFGGALYFFFKTDMGAAMRATGSNPQMITALGVNTKAMIILGIALSNGFIALSGALLAQYQGFADIQMGLGMFVLGIANLIIGETLVGKKRLGLILPGVVLGSILFRQLVAVALRLGMNPNDLKLITAIFVLGALILPLEIEKFRKRKRLGGNARRQ